MDRRDFLTTGAGLFSAALLCNLLWGSAAPCIKLGYRLFAIDAADSMSQILFAGLRFTLAGVLALLMGSLSRRRFLRPQRSSWGMILILALVQTVIQYVFYYIGLGTATGFQTSVINPSSTFFAILFAALLFRQEKLSGRKLLGCAVGFAGVVLINLRNAAGSGGFRLTGEGFILISAMSYAMSSVLIKGFSLREDPVTLSGYQFLLGGGVMIAVGLLGGGRAAPPQSSAWLLMVYLSFVSAAAYSVNSLLLQRHPVSRVSIFSFINPIVGVLLSALLLGEGKLLDPLLAAAALALVSLGIWIVNGRPEPARSAEQKE